MLATPRPNFATPRSNPLTFLGPLALLATLALAPASALTIEWLLQANMPLVPSLIITVFAFPALLFPLLPTQSRQHILREAGWTRALLSIPALVLGIGLCQVAFIESYGTWDGVTSLTRLLFGVANVVAAISFMFWPKFPTSH